MPLRSRFELASAAGLTLILALAVVPAAFGQGVQTGELSGSVTSSDGQPLPGVSVTITSPSLQGSRTALTTVNGDYILKALPSGVYKISFELSGFTTVEKTQAITLGTTARANALLNVATVQETVVVTAAAPSVVSETHTGANIKAEEYDLLARDRDLEAVTELAPGLTETSVNNDIAISGAFSYDNLFLLDGVDINDSSYSDPNNIYIEDAVEETQVLTSGISAEYGRFTGGAVNAITKRGGNQFSGSFRTDFTNPSWTKETPFEETQGIELEDRTFKRYQATLGGPIVKDRLWFFTAGRYRSLDDPLIFDETGIGYTESSTDKRFEVKLTGTVTPNHTLQAAYTKNDTEVEGGVNSCCQFIDPASINPQRFPLSLFVANYAGVLRSNLFAEAQYSQQRTKLEFGGTSTDIRDSPFIGANTPGTFHAPYFDATDPSVRNNRQIAGALSYFLSTASLGRHDIKGGWENFRNTDVGGNSQSATSYVFYTDYALDDAGKPVVVDGKVQPLFIPGGTFILNWRAVRGAKIDITTNSFYLNDKWTLNDQWVFNLGLRYERVRSEATGDIVSVDTDTIVPRLAATYDVRGDGRFTLQGTYGHYAGRYNTYQFAGNTNVGNPTLIYGIYTGPEGLGSGFAPGFDPANYVTLNGSFPTQNVIFEDGLSSPVNREFTLGAGVGFGTGNYAKLVYIQRSLSDFVEDFVTIDGGITNVTVDGIDFGNFPNRITRNSDLPVRDYRALQLQAAYRLTDRWNVSGHWTVQLRNDGNFEGENSGSPGISSGIGDYPELFVPSRNFPEGRLNGFERHKVRAWTTYDQGLGRAGRLGLGVLWRYDSAGVFSLAANNVPFTEIQLARDPGYARLPPNQTLFFDERGSEFYNSSHSFDVALNYDIPVYRTLRPWAKFEVRNVFNNESLISFNTTVNPDFDSPLDEHGLPTAFTRGSRFGQATSKAHFPVARTMAFSVGFRF
jgi:hypothetical protein